MKGAAGKDERYPPTLDAFLARCAAAGQIKPTPLLLRYNPGGYNCGQDVYGDVAFPLQAVVFLSEPGVHYQGGEFLLVEQRPPAQSMGDIVRARRRGVAVFTTRVRPGARFTRLLPRADAPRRDPRPSRAAPHAGHPLPRRALNRFLHLMRHRGGGMMQPRVLPACVLVLLWTTVSAQAATYYVSPSGNNARSGLSPDQAWLSIERVNAHDFAPGDQILFQGGHTFAGTVFFDQADSGTPENPVVVSSYGSGRATIYAGNGRGILGYNTAGFRITELFIVGSGRDVNTESGILFFTDLPGDVLLDGLVIDHVDAVRFGGYGIEIGGNAGRSGFQNVSISFVIASENGLGGVFTYAQQRAVHRNVRVTNSSAFLNAGFFGLLFNSGNGITLSGVDGGLIERCVAHSNGWRSDAANGPIGIWAFNSNNVVIQLNESFSNKTGGTKDGGGFSLDNSTSNSVLQYNYSHDNAGAGYLLAHKWNDFVHTGNVIRYNISQNDARLNRYAAIHTWGRIRNAEIYNNTVYMTFSQGGQRAVYLRNTSIEAQDPERLHIRNNIFHVKGGVQLVDAAASVLDAAVDVRFEGNVWWTSGSPFRIAWKGVLYSTLAAWRTATGQERLNGLEVGMSADPQLTLPGTAIGYNNAFLIHDVWQYRLKATSPAIDAGVDLAALGVTRGPRDYYGAPPLRNLPDIGAHEYHGDCNWTLTPSAASVGAAGGSGNVSVGMSAVWGCGWAATSNQSWAGAFPASGTAPGTFTWFAGTNGGAARAATIRVADRTFRISQEGTVSPLPTGWSAGDVGSVGVPGEVSVTGGTWTLRGAGADIWGTADAFQFAYQQLDGDWEIEARVVTVENVNAWTKAGVMVRQSLHAGAAHGAMMVTPGKGLAYQYRAQNGGLTSNISGGTGVAPYWVKLTRQGTKVSAYRKAPTASAWTHVGDATIALGSTMHVGLFVSSHDAAGLATAVFDNVTLRRADLAPPPPTGPGEDVVMWAADASVVSGWTLTADASAAGGQRLQNANAGAAKVVTAAAAPTQFFELSFHALAGRPYRLWLRGKAISNAATNDSVHVQFDGSTDAAGAAVARIGTTGSYAWNLEECSGCGLSGWGWEDNGWGVGVMGPLLYFQSTGTQRIRIQVREDGVGIDQIVLSSVRWLNAAPGANKNDTTVLQKR